MPTELKRDLADTVATSAVMVLPADQRQAGFVQSEHLGRLFGR